MHELKLKYTNPHSISISLKCSISHKLCLLSLNNKKQSNTIPDSQATVYLTSPHRCCLGGGGGCRQEWVTAWLAWDIKHTGTRLRKEPRNGTWPSDEVTSARQVMLGCNSTSGWCHCECIARARLNTVQAGSSGTTVSTSHKTSKKAPKNKWRWWPPAQIEYCLQGHKLIQMICLFPSVHVYFFLCGEVHKTFLWLHLEWRWSPA